MSDHIDRLRAFRHWYETAQDKSYAAPELLDGLALLADYDALAADNAALRERLAEAEKREQLLQRALCFWHPGVRVDDVPEAATKRAADDARLLYGLEEADEQSAADLGWVAWVVPGEFARLRARLAEAEAATKTWENEAERRSRRYEKAAVRLAEAEALLQIAAFTDALDPTDGVRLGWEYCVFCGEREHDRNCRYAKFLRPADSATHRENERD